VTSSETVTVTEHVDRFLEQPEIALGGLARVARAMETGRLPGLAADVRTRITEAALALEPVTAPVLVRSAARESARVAVEPILRAARGEEAPAWFTYSWKTEDDGRFTCPFRHDPLLLLPEKSRQEVLAEAVRSGEIAYPLAVESRAHCPWCRRRSAEALARAGGVWQEFVSEAVVHEAPRESEPGERCPAAEVMAANRGGRFLPLSDGRDLAEIVRIMRGDSSWPPVVGLVFIPVTDEELAAWQEHEGVAEALGECWFQLDVR
jgi:hypothetical protein